MVLLLLLLLLLARMAVFDGDASMARLGRAVHCKHG